MRLTRNERRQVEEVVAAYCQNRRGVRTTFQRVQSEVRKVAADPRHPVFKDKAMYRSVTVRQARRKLKVLAELNQRLKRVRCRRA
jgi:hypothetical protein